MSQRRGRFERTIFSFVIKPRQFGSGICLRVEGQSISRGVVPVTESERPVIAACDRNLPDAAQPRCQPIPKRAFLREGAHFKARAIRKAACSRKSRSFSVKAFSFSLSTSIKPMTLPCSVMTGTTISDIVLPKVGK